MAMMAVCFIIHGGGDSDGVRVGVTIITTVEMECSDNSSVKLRRGLFTHMSRHP